ncbi:CMRF35-like molecule 3 isoform X3 [Acanthopagrus latus]|uniref:CMRF35-like molecule 3 isoform X3 n=1 Tax=Acanthopagrus latus TaxID=8177 RepID=UPI00187C5128|nr:CMRF35-like molecule 3 isoform X3 [Acanthopagrus latus]
MTFLYIPHLILAGLVGIHCDIITVSKVSVKARGSISIPCLYEPRYRDRVKYLCVGKHWPSCKKVVKTNKPHDLGKFLIFDDKTRNIFTVTVKDLTEMNTGYWCAVELKLKADIRTRFQLSVTTGERVLYVDRQEVEAFEDGSVTVICRYNEDPKVTGWCRLGNPSCVTDQTGAIDGTTVTIDAGVPKVFNVTMSELRTESSGWYWCTNGDFQVPVKVIVDESTSTTATASTMIPRTASSLPATIQHSSLLTSAEPHTAQATTSTVNGSGEETLQDEHRSSTLMTILIHTFIVLLLLVPAAVLGWYMIRRGKTKPEGSDMTVDSQTGGDPDVYYSTIGHNQHVAAQKKQHQTPEDTVIYSTTVMRDSVQQMTEPADGSVIYSNLQ